MIYYKAVINSNIDIEIMQEKKKIDVTNHPNHSGLTCRPIFSTVDARELELL